MKRYALPILALATGMSQAQVIDGTADATYGSPLWVQNIGTGFGDSSNGQVDIAGGSELDSIYGKIIGQNLYLVFTGNYESNYNHLTIFIDTDSTGFNTLPGDNAFTGDFGYFNGLAGVKFDNGFKARYGVEFRNGDASATNTLYVDMAELGSTANPLGIMDAANDNGGGLSGVIRHVVNANGFELALNNSNVLGVDGNQGAAESGAGVTTGAELKIPLSLIGLGVKVRQPTYKIRIAAFITGGNYLSNQVAGGMPVGTQNLANPPTDFTTFAGVQYVTVGAPSKAIGP